MPQSILDRLGAVKFPSLNRVEFGPVVDAFPTFLSPTSVEVLEHLKISFINNDPHSTPGTSLFMQMPALTLVTLSLSGDIPQWSLQPNSVYFPVLETLQFWLRNADDFFKAIIAPKLTYLEYGAVSKILPSTVFSGLADKFSSVRKMSLPMFSIRLNTLDALALCRAFPRVLHAEFDSACTLSAFFRPCKGIDGLRSPADYWESLETVVFDRFDPGIWLELPIRENNDFVRWLMTRQDLRPLRVRFKDSYIPNEDDVESFCRLYEILREYCVVELQEVTLRHDSTLSNSASSRLQLSVPVFTTGLVDDIVALTGGTTE
ncbi:hypothetical protein F5J12DRAFT_825181 [Pisolithus orientalis]|uniref:uncharacterized protein n=1 Tax=Pisolithus orientalis TaxID=936130 RepID=UPI00222578A2|nr:uncharacterized protein F5J12DRAFT_825181 [Pisolithus orientalis]KAI6008729.1 hypothetical protein F5J12DRAFT_825181 [Pisolithus orientalis]